MALRLFDRRRGNVSWAAMALVSFAFGAVLLSPAMAQESRTWTDATGKYKIKAKFVELANDAVTLEREDGSQVVIPLKKLSQSDQKAVAELQASEQNPFQAVKPAEKAAGRSTRRPPASPARRPARRRAAEEDGQEEDASDTIAGEAKIVRPRWSDAKQVLPVPGENQWRIPVATVPEAAAGKGRAVALPAKLDFFEKARTLAINPVCRRAAVGYVLDRPGGRDDTQIRILLCDLEAGKVLATIKTPGKMVPLALSDAGDELLMCREEFGFGNHDRLETWKIADSKATKLLQWVPHGDQHGGQRDIKWASYIDPQRLATASGGGKLTVWNATSATPLYWLKIQDGCSPALSPDRKYLAFATDKEIGVLDLGAGEVIALQSSPKEHLFAPVFAFTPKGTRLVCGAQDRVYVWDVATGGLYRDISLSGANVHMGDNLLCPSEETVLVGNSLLIDIESQAKLWTYRGHELAGMLGGVCWLAVTGQDSGALLPTQLPHPSVTETIRKAVDSADFFVLKPGTTVKFDLTGLSDPGEREKAAAAFTQKLRANGCQVGDNGTVELVAATEMGKRREIAYHTFGHPVARAYMFQEHTSRIKIVYQGQTAWEVSCTNVPGFVRLKQGETMETFLQQKEHPNYEWFSTVDLPKVVQKPVAGGGTLGTTQVTIAGLR
jgi:hypothetical protein